MLYMCKSLLGKAMDGRSVSCVIIPLVMATDDMMAQFARNKLEMASSLPVTFRDLYVNLFYALNSR